MYTMVLMMAVSSPAEAPSCGWRGNCGGCTGCVGCAGCGGCRGVAAGWGGCAGSCAGWGARKPGLFSGLFAGKGCGGCGYQTIATCHGCGGCVGWYSHAPVYYGFAGCYGSCFGSYTNYFSYWSTPPAVRYGVPAPAVEPPAVKPKMKPADPKEPPKVGGPAKVIIELPTDAILFANGYRTQQTSATRRFQTPELEPGQRYSYIFTVEAIVDGKTIKEEREVEVYAGGETHVDFNAVFATKRAELVIVK